MIKVLITGANSYIGENFKNRLSDFKDEYVVDTVDMLDGSWRETDFSQYDTVFHVAGIAHADVGNVSEEGKKLYYSVNTCLAVEVAEKAKSAGVGQFVFMSSMIVYSGCGVDTVTGDTEPKPLNFYGDSKWQADLKIRAMETAVFKVAIIRPPMIYGNGSKGNYPQLAKLAVKLPVFPAVKNRRSVLYIENLCECIRLIIENNGRGVFFPQNSEYVSTSELVKLIAEAKGHKIIIIPGFGAAIKLIMKFPGKMGDLAAKAFGNSAYDMDMSELPYGDYRVADLKNSIFRTEKYSGQ